MGLHFSPEELAGRRRRAIELLEKRGLDGLLIFRQESMYYLIGYDTMGYSMFQCLYMGADGDLVLLTRSPDLRRARFTSVIEDVRVWVDRADSNPGLDLRAVLEEKGCRGWRLGVEMHAYGLTVLHRLNECGYSLSALYPPTWMDWPMVYEDNPVVLEPNMVIFMHMIILDSDRDLAMALGETVVVGEGGCERLSRLGPELVVN